MATTPLNQRQTMQMSANDLAQFMVSSDTARISIIRRAKFPQKPPIIRYADVRPVLVAYLSDHARNLSTLVSAETMFKQRSTDPGISSLKQDDASKSIEVLHSLQAMNNKISIFDFQAAPTKQPLLNIHGIDISVRADLIVNGAGKDKGSIGAALLRMTQDDADSESAKQRRREMGLYVAALVKMQADSHLAAGRPVLNKLCMSIDIQHGEVFQASNSIVRRTSDLENACRFIAAMWPSIQPT